MTQSPQPRPPQALEKPTRPEDIDTGFWLWVVALPLMIAGYICDAVTAPMSSPLMVAIAVIFAVVLVTVVVTFLLLMRAGYRWARTVLTGGALASILYTASSLFTVQRPTAAALIYAGTGIIGAVLLAGGIVLVHRKDGHGFFTR
ncbi:MAG TPA: hypothetical protein VIU87_17360 [Mycobacterium sp.]